MTEPPTPTTQRTRLALVEAAVAVWSRNRDATLNDVADAARTHRATLHRHFRSHADLVDAAVHHAVRELVTATEQAGIDQDEPLVALRRLIANYFGIGDRIRFIFEDIATARHPELDALQPVYEQVLALIRRGQVANHVEPSLDPAWVLRTMWALVYTATEAVDDGLLQQHQALPTLLRTIQHGIT